jgi:hypothetical protein
MKTPWMIQQIQVGNISRLSMSTYCSLAETFVEIDAQLCVLMHDRKVSWSTSNSSNLLRTLAFPSYIVPVPHQRPILKDPACRDPEWMVGTEGCRLDHTSYHFFPHTGWVLHLLGKLGLATRCYGVHTDRTGTVG